jgi:hypothetical protein
MPAGAISFNSEDLRMRLYGLRSSVIALIAILLLAACSSLPPAAASSDGHADGLVGTLQAFGTQIAQTQQAYPTITPNGTVTPGTATPTATIGPGISANLEVPGAAAENARVVQSTLCQLGRGRGDVISGLAAGQRVRVLGRGSTWWVVENPVYHVPCWVASAALQIDPGVDPLSFPPMSSLSSPTPTVAVQFMTPVTIPSTPMPEMPYYRTPTPAP